MARKPICKRQREALRRCLAPPPPGQPPPVVSSRRPGSLALKAVHRRQGQEKVRQANATFLPSERAALVAGQEVLRDPEPEIEPGTEPDSKSEEDWAATARRAAARRAQDLAGVSESSPSDSPPPTKPERAKLKKKRRRRKRSKYKKSKQRLKSKKKKKKSIRRKIRKTKKLKK